jgi:hypothetical protein
MVILSLVYASLTTIIQQDTKTLVAYSSVAPCGPKYLWIAYARALLKGIKSILQQIICKEIDINVIQGTLNIYNINIVWSYSQNCAFFILNSTLDSGLQYSVGIGFFPKGGNIYINHPLAHLGRPYFIEAKESRVLNKDYFLFFMSQNPCIFIYNLQIKKISEILHLLLNIIKTFIISNHSNIKLLLLILATIFYDNFFLIFLLYISLDVYTFFIFNNNSALAIFFSTTIGKKNRVQKKSKDINNSNLCNAYPSIQQKARGMHTQAGHTPDDLIFYQWLSGLIDGDGYFYLTKDGKVFLTITMDKRDTDCLLFIQSKLGGKIYNVANQKAIRYRLFRKDDIFKLICAINGNIRNPIRINQLKPIYLKYNISMLQPKILTYNDGWLAGFFDSDGSISINFANYSISFSITQKYKDFIEVLPQIYGGKVRIHDKKQNTFRWVVSKKDEVSNLQQLYFSNYELKSKKMVRVNLISQFYNLKSQKAHLQDTNSILGKEWENLKNKWNKDFK